MRVQHDRHISCRLENKAQLANHLWLGHKPQLGPKAFQQAPSHRSISFCIFSSDTPLNFDTDLQSPLDSPCELSIYSTDNCQWLFLRNAIAQPFLTRVSLIFFFDFHIFLTIFAIGSHNTYFLKVLPLHRRKASVLFHFSCSMEIISIYSSHDDKISLFKFQDYIAGKRS